MKEPSNRKPKQLLLDTNFFLAPFQTGINIFSELERIMPEPFELMTITPVKKELEKIIKSGKGDDKIAARLGTELARNIKVVDAEGIGDQAIIDYAKSNKIIVATNDSALRKELTKLKTRTIFIRNNSKLEIE